MLKLKRRLFETIRISHDVHVKVLGIHNGTVEIGVTAPRNVPVHREEIYQKILIANAKQIKPINDVVWHRKNIL
jgi:carbon storage regulator